MATPPVHPGSVSWTPVQIPGSANRTPFHAGLRVDPQAGGTMSDDYNEIESTPQNLTFSIDWNNMTPSPFQVSPFKLGTPTQNGAVSSSEQRMKTVRKFVNKPCPPTPQHSPVKRRHASGDDYGAGSGWGIDGPSSFARRLSEGLGESTPYKGHGGSDEGEIERDDAMDDLEDEDDNGERHASFDVMESPIAGEVNQLKTNLSLSSLVSSPGLSRSMLNSSNPVSMRDSPADSLGGHVDYRLIASPNNETESSRPPLPLHPSVHHGASGLSTSQQNETSRFSSPGGSLTCSHCNSSLNIQTTPTNVSLRKIAAPPPCNVNPFTPESRLKRSTLSAGEPEGPGSSTRKGPGSGEQRRWASALESSVLSGAGSPYYSRYREDFEEVEEIGSGQFSIVYKCCRRVDGWHYAVKRVGNEKGRKIRGELDEQEFLKEVYALAALGDHQNVVRYFSAWIENGYLYIQTELCDGTLRTLVDQGTEFTEELLLRIMRDVLVGLSYIHGEGIVHLDMKPENIYFSSLNGTGQGVSYGTVYKIGDLGFTTPANESNDLKEGDSRYLSRELLEETVADLTKVDIFALGASMYELAIGRQLPTCGVEWQKIRNGDLSELSSSFSDEFRKVVEAMMHPIPGNRPSAMELLENPLLMTDKEREAHNLKIELERERRVSKELQEQLGRYREVILGDERLRDILTANDLNLMSA